ncbi:hypothetical protein, partial [Enterobacter hormaechei]
MITLEGENDFIVGPSRLGGLFKVFNVCVGYKTVTGKVILCGAAAAGAAAAPPAQEEKNEAA